MNRNNQPYELSLKELTGLFLTLAIGVTAMPFFVAAFG